MYLADGTFLNAEIVKQGHGHAYTQFPFRFLEQFREYERTARDTGQGWWNGDTPSATTRATSASDGKVRVWVNTASGVYHCPGTRYCGDTKAT